MLEWIRGRLVEDAHMAWRWLSVQFAAAAALLAALSESIKQGWLSLPDDLKASLPSYLGKAIGLLILASIIGRLVKQKDA